MRRTLWPNYYIFRNVQFSKPIYRRIEKIPFLPRLDEVYELINGCTKPIATFLQFLLETGCRAGEAWPVKWIDLNNGTVNIVPQKHSRPRILKLSPRLCKMMDYLPRKGDKVFGYGSLHNLSAGFFKQTKHVAQDLGSPRLKAIHFHTLRHLKASLEYHRTKDIVHVQRLLGHRSIQNTLRHIQLADFDDDEFVCKVASTIQEAKDLVEKGFEYVTDVGEVKLFRKRK